MALRNSSKLCQVQGSTALSDRTGTASFAHVDSIPSLSGLLARCDLPTGSTISTIEVPTLCLDDVVPPDLPVVPLWWEDRVVVQSRRLRGFAPSPTGDLRGLARARMDP